MFSILNWIEFFNILFYNLNINKKQMFQHTVQKGWQYHKSRTAIYSCPCISALFLSVFLLANRYQPWIHQFADPCWLSHIFNIFKGQLISKCLFIDFNFFQKTSENTSHSNKNEFFRTFFGRIHGLTICFWN